MKTFEQRLRIYKRALKNIEMDIKDWGGFKFGLCYALSNFNHDSRLYPKNVGMMKKLYPEITPFIPAKDWGGYKIDDNHMGFWWSPYHSSATLHRIHILKTIIAEMTNTLKEKQL